MQRTQPQITEMPFRTGLILSHTLVFGEIWLVIGGDIFTRQITDMAHSHGITQTTSANIFIINFHKHYFTDF